MDSSIFLWALAVLLVVFGMIGTIFPALPGPGLVFVGLLVAAWAEQFAYIGFWSIAILGGLTLLAYGVDFLATALGAKRMGASKRAVLGAALGAMAGLFLGIPGVILGSFVGAVLGELTVRGDLRKAGQAGFGAWIGLVLGTAAKLALVFTMIGFFVTMRLL